MQHETGVTVHLSKNQAPEAYRQDNAGMVGLEQVSEYP